MRFIIVSKFFVPNGYAAIALFPFIFFKKQEYITDRRINHEKIHLRQQIEMLIIPFYLLYGIHFLYNIICGISHPYRNIVFEIEAYNNESSKTYLKTRGFFAWTKYFNNR